jgi:signal transduction histidine kinase
MKSFRTARLRLTAWYVSFVMILSICVSIIVYRSLMLELERSLRAQTTRIFGTYALQGQIVTPNDIADIYNDAKSRILYHIVILNGGMLVLSTTISYFAAGKALQPLEQAVEEQKRFIADASHELKTPLTALKTEIEVALRDKKMTGSDAKNLLRSNLEEVEKMKQLTNYLLALSRYDNSNRSLQTQKVEIEEIINRSIKLVSQKAKVKNIDIKVQIQNFKLLTNFSSLEDLVVILLDNAIKYSTERKAITIRTLLKRNIGIIEIQDQGIGIKSSDIPYIFNRFYRADTSRSKHHAEGFGLGLAIAKSIVEMHRGKIEVESTPGKGTLFRVKVPLTI